MTARIYALANQKGGVGKTTTAINLGDGLAALGQRVLLVDADPQANATGSLGMDKSLAPSVYEALINGVPLVAVVRPTSRPCLELAPAALSLAGAEVELIGLPHWQRRLRQSLEPIAPKYDYVLIDCPPSLGLLTVNALAAAQGVIVPVQCEYLPLEGLTQLMKTIHLVRDSLNPSLRLLGLVLTMYDGRTHLSHQVAQEVRRHFPAQTFRTVIPRSVRLAEAPSYGQPILAYDPASRGAQAYRALAEEVMAWVKEESRHSASR